MLYNMMILTNIINYFVILCKIHYSNEQFWDFCFKAIRKFDILLLPMRILNVKEFPYNKVQISGGKHISW